MMKKFLNLTMILLFSTLIHAQSNYENQWKKVEQFEIDGLPKSALSEVENIYTNAKRKQNSAQIIKAVIFKSKFALILEEDAQLKVINDIKSEISSAKAPEKNIFHQILAKLYWQYFQQNRYRFYNRTNTTNKVDETDFRTWDLQTIFEETHHHYQLAMQEAITLQNTSLESLRPILHHINSKNKETVYDFILNDALQFYKATDLNLNKPAYKFEITNPQLIKNNKTFLASKLESKDSLSLTLNALKIYRNLTAFHANDKDKTTLIQTTLERLKFVKQYARFSSKNEDYHQTLLALKDTYKNDSAFTDIVFELATYYVELGNTYTVQNDKNRYKIAEAIELCELAKSEFPDTNGAIKCNVLKNNVLSPQLSLTAESHIEPNKPSLVLVNYKNLPKLNFSVYPFSQSQLIEFNSIWKETEKAAFVKKLQPIKQFSKSLKNENDFQNHATEIILPALTNGTYLITADTSTNYSKTYAFATFQVSNLVLLETLLENQIRFQVVDRNSGKPIENAKIHLQRKKTRYDAVINKKFYTNDKGFAFYTKTKKSYYNVVATVTYKEDKAIFGNMNLRNAYRQNNHKYNQNKIFLFTDRSIYRPAQTVYFKGIAINQIENKSTVLTNINVLVTLKDVNYQEVKTLELKTNEFGSFSGEFILPNSGLTGNFQIQVNAVQNFKGKLALIGQQQLNGNTSFSVEEYKRPKFSAEFDKITTTFKVNDSIKITGKAKAYAGSNISNAKVVYTVKREVQYPKWFYYYRSFGQQSEAQEITHGETITKDDGTFEMVFLAQPDVSVNKDNQPTFSYVIHADITDINGETRSTSTTVKVGYHSLVASLEIEPSLDKNNKNSAIINTTNLNGEFVPSSGIIKVYKTNSPTKTLRDRPWNAPDYQVISKEEFETTFPHIPFKKPKAFDENLSELVWTSNFDTAKDKKIDFPKTKKWKSGNYFIVLESEDKFKQKVEAKSAFSLFSDKDKTLADRQLFTIKTDKQSYKPNEQVKLRIGTSAKDLVLVMDIERKNKITETKVIKLNNEVKTISLPVTEKDRGNFGLSYYFVHYNQYKSGVVGINVPYKKTELDIETVTFRDKLQPNQEEKWEFKIKGNQKEKVTAEILTSMYDASLDQFKSHQWTMNPIYFKNYSVRNRTNTHQSFGNTNFQLRNNQNRHLSYPQTKPYATLNWFGFRFNHYNVQPMMAGTRILKSRKARVSSPEMESAEMVSDVSKSLKGQVAGVNVVSNSGAVGNSTRVVLRGATSITGDKKPLYIIDGKVVSARLADIKESDIISIKVLKGPAAVAFYGVKAANGAIIITTKNTVQDLSNVKTRTNFNETAFFFPHLKTDKDGNVSFSFTTPESLTKWKLQLLAHTKNLHATTKTLETVTQKELMVLPNVPRFLREGDKITISTKISNISDKELNGEAKLILTNAITNKDVTKELLSSLPLGEMSQSDRVGFSVKANNNTAVSWDIEIPKNIQALQYKIVAKAGDFSDGEQNVLPVLSNRMLVTETLPMWLTSNETKTFTLDKLKTNTSKSLSHHKLTLEFTSNPAWYAVQALPYLMEYPYECAEQTFSRYYANTLASHIANSNPRIQQVFNQWKNTDALLSNLEKNQELKSLIIQETPWLRDAQSETEQKKRIALLFDLHKMKNEQSKALSKLKQMQMPSGGFPWFKGSRYENRYITQHIVTGIGHLNKLGVTSSGVEKGVENISEKAIEYLDSQILKDYNQLVLHAKKQADHLKTESEKEKSIQTYLAKNNTSHFQVHYLYMRSFFKDKSIPKKVQKAVDYYTNQSYQYWLDYNLYSKGLIALVSHRNDHNAVAEKILASLRETSITSEELGMYWKENTASYYWYQAPIETQALMVEVFSEVGNNVTSSGVEKQKEIDNLKIWLLKNKQTNRWKTTKATTEAVYALLLQGTNWIETTEFVDITIDNKTIKPLELENSKVEAGTGYFKTSWNGAEINPNMASVTVKKDSEGIAWGAMYWQYFEDLDKITSAKTPLQLSKKLFLKTNGDTGKELSLITDKTTLKVGDLVTVRVALKSDRNMEFIHMKDMRASGFEPTNVISQYKWQDGLGYYQSTKDASTNFFIDFLPKGIYVFEYDLRVNNKGDFSNGITSIQSMYAPEFSSHSEGIRVKME